MRRARLLALPAAILAILTLSGCGDDPRLEEATTDRINLNSEDSCPKIMGVYHKWYDVASDTSEDSEMRLEAQRTVDMALIRKAQEGC